MRQQHQKKATQSSINNSPSSLFISRPSPARMQHNVAHPDAIVDLNSRLDQTMLAVQRFYRPDNTNIIMDSKQQEFL